MARKSRRNETEIIAPTTATVLFPTAVYARLSSEDMEASSIENQILIVKKHIEDAPDLILSGVFSDNGLTGTNFNRPGFEALLDEIRRGKINCVVVKDLSRFGRDYVEAGSFLEIIFPRLGVRFISIGDNYDSFDPRCRGDGMSVALKNMINAFYAKDISQKIRSAYEIKRKNGEFVAKKAPFGFRKSPDNKNQLIVDEQSAEIVRMVFRMKLDAMGITQIARSLSEQGIPTPGHYQYITGIHKEKRYAEPQYWDVKTVKEMLERMEYLGHLTMRKTETVGGKQRKLPKEEWQIAYNTHEPIISQAGFDTVAELLRQTRERHESLNRHNRDELPPNLLKGIACCAHCGRSYRRIANTHRDKTTYRLTYICAYCNKHSPKYTHKHFRQDALYHTIYTMICNEIKNCVDSRDKYVRINMATVADADAQKISTNIKITQSELDRVPAIKMKLYDDFCAGILGSTEYRLRIRQCEADKEKHDAELAALLIQQQKLHLEAVDGNSKVSVLEQFLARKELTREMLLALVERIEIQGDQEIKVFYRFKDEYAPLLSLMEEHGGAL